MAPVGAAAALLVFDPAAAEVVLAEVGATELVLVEVTNVLVFDAALELEEEEEDPDPAAGASARIFCEACSATATIRADGLVETMPGKMEASTTKS